MRLSFSDFAVIAGYLLIVVTIGLIARRQTGKSNTDYLLGGRKIPFWMLSISNASGMFDISGTAWMVSIMFVYGVKSVWLPWLWPVFNQVFLMVYLSGWLRKSNVSTGAEWMLTRFGHSGGARLAHAVIVLFALLSCVSFMAYAFVGLGKFLEIFIPWQLVSGYVPFAVPEDFVPHFYGIIFTAFTVFYSVLGGMKSIVWIDLVHYSIVVLVSIFVAALAVHSLSATTLPVPEGWTDLSFGKQLNLNWAPYIQEAAAKITDDGFNPFGYFFALMAAKGILASIAGPTPSYDMQKILSARTPREAALMSMLVNLVLLPPRYLLVTGVAVLGLLHYQPGSTSDFEQMLPTVLHRQIPNGLLGLVLVAMLGSFMGTFAGTLNAAQAYIVQDIYLKSIHPGAGYAQVRRMNRLSGVVIVLIAFAVGFVSKSLNNIVLWIVAALYGGYIPANVLKFHWWRFNSYGFFASMLAGIACALLCPLLLPDTQPLFYFPVILAVSLIAAIVTSYLTPVTDWEVLKSFYRNIAPWGFWKPVKLAVSAPPSRHSRRDILNIITGITAQTSLTLIPVYFVLQMFVEMGIVSSIFLICAAVLRFSWYKHLQD